MVFLLFTACKHPLEIKIVWRATFVFAICAQIQHLMDPTSQLNSKMQLDVDAESIFRFT